MKNIWLGETDDVYLLPDLTKNDIEYAERELEIQIPFEYISLLKVQNGGFLKYNALPVSFKNSWADSHIPINHILGIKKGKGILESESLLREWGITDKRLIVISGDGHYWIALDYRNNQEPQIVFIDTEEQRIEVVCKTFKEVLENLYVEHYEVDFLHSEELSLSRAKVLIDSNNEDEVIEGIHIWLSNLVELEELVEHLMKFIKSEKNDLQFQAIQTMHYLIMNDLFTDNALIHKFLEAIKDNTDVYSQHFYNEVKVYTNLEG